MGERRNARECALQLLFQIDLTGDDAVTGASLFWPMKKVTHSVRQFAEKLALGYWEHREQIDGIITKKADNWRLDRMAIVDRNIMRIAIFEFLFEDDIPEKVSINEAIEIAKKFGGPESTQFINGILDAIKSGLDEYKK